MKFTNLKNLAIAAGLFLGTNLAANAQGAYAKIGAGYNFGTSSATLPQYSGKQVDRVKLNYGKGVLANAALGYMFSPNIGAELGLGYLAGAKTEIKSVYDNRVDNDIYYSRMLLITPSLVISAGKEGLNPYAKFGLVAAKGKLVNEAEYNHNDFREIKTETKGGWGLGLQAALGVEFGLSEQLGLFTELSMNNLSYAPEKTEIVSYRVNGGDVLHTIPTRNRETVYTDSYNSDQGNSNMPREVLKENLPLNSVGINVGVKFNF